MNGHDCDDYRRANGRCGWCYSYVPAPVSDSFTVTITQDANRTFTVRLSHSGNEYSAMVSGVLDYDIAQSLANDLVGVIC